MELLFERLTHSVSRSRSEPVQLAALQKSVITELARIFSTRNYFGETDGIGPDVLSFGIPRLVNFSEANSTDLHALRNEIERVVRRFEPRLKNPVVLLHAEASRAADPVCLTIAGQVELGSDSAQVVFPITTLMIAA